MKTRLFALLLSFGVVLPACSAASPDDIDTGAVSSDVISSPNAPAPAPPAPCPFLSSPSPSFCPGGVITAKKNAIGCTIGYDCATQCEAKGGECVGLSPVSCTNGTFAPASTHACGGGIGVACCIVAPPPPPPPPTCPVLSSPSPSFCPGGMITAKKDANGCTIGYDCKTQCELKGGECVGISPVSCTNGTWAPASTHACSGGGIGVGCCVP